MSEITVKFTGGEMVVRQSGVTGVQARAQVESIKRRSADLKPVYIAFEPIWHESERRVFASEGIPAWPRLSPAYARRKYSEVGALPILVYTGRLRASLTGRSKDTVYEATARTLRAGTKVPYSVYLQARRAHVTIEPDALDELSKLTLDYLTVPLG